MKAIAIDDFGARRACTTCLSPRRVRARCWSGSGLAR
jgi:hypothetical protein